MSSRRAFAFIALLAGTLPACGATFQPSGSLDASLIQPVTDFFADADVRLPKAVRQLFPEPIEVRFVAYPQTATGEFPIQSTDGSHDDDGAFRGHVYGRARTHRGDECIELNARFLPDILAGPDKAREYSGHHGTVYRLALGTLFHELAHLAAERLPVNERAWVRRRRHRSPLRRWHLASRSVPYPESQRFLDVIGWDSRTVPRNTLRYRSPNAYELANSIEYFAVNMEYFLLDPSYRQRRPRMHEALSDALGITVHRDSSDVCYIPTSEDAVELPVGTLESVQILRIEPAGSLVSRFGHLMLRFLFQEHAGEVIDIVAEFSAYADSPIDWRLGVWGGYPSRLTFHRFPVVAMRYNVLQDREIACIPLHLTEAQRTRLLHRTLEVYWQYRGEYRFFSRNCSTEVYDLVRSIGFDSPRPRYLPRTPAAVCTLLCREKLLDEDVARLLEQDRDQAFRKGYLYPAKGDMMQEAFELVASHSADFAQNAQQYVVQTTAEERRGTITTILAHDVSDGTEIVQTRRLAALLLLEKLCHTLRSEQFQRLIESGEGADELQQLSQRHRELIRFGKEESDFIALGTGYGIPLDRERHRSGHLHTTNAYAELESLASAFRTFCAESFPQQWEELQGSQKNLDLVRAHFYPLAGLHPKGWEAVTAEDPTRDALLSLPPQASKER